MRHPRPALALILFLAAGSAVAHPGHDSAGFLAGFTHPLGGLDHFLAMLAVGLFAARQAGAARWVLPAGFITAMLLGAGLGAGLFPAGLALPGLEQGIAASVLVLGLLICALARLPLGLALPLVAVFAVYHGYAHGAEMGEARVLAYAVGFVCATALLHGAGYLMAAGLPRRPWADPLRRAAGAVIAAAGVALLGA